MPLWRQIWGSLGRLFWPVYWDSPRDLPKVIDVRAEGGFHKQFHAPWKCSGWTQLRTSIFWAVSFSENKQTLPSQHDEVSKHLSWEIRWLQIVSRTQRRALNAPTSRWGHSALPRSMKASSLHRVELKGVHCIAYDWYQTNHHLLIDVWHSRDPFREDPSVTLVVFKQGSAAAVKVDTFYLIAYLSLYSNVHEDHSKSFHTFYTCDSNTVVRQFLRRGRRFEIRRYIM